LQEEKFSEALEGWFGFATFGLLVSLVSSGSFFFNGGRPLAEKHQTLLRN